MISTGDFKNLKTITWTINEICNFNCEYCFQTHKKQELKPIDIKKLSKGLDFLGKDFIIEITGGEPFLENNILDICKEVTKKHYLKIITNLTTDNVYDFANIIDPQRCLSIITTVHIIERKKKDPQLNSYVDKMLYLQEKGFNAISYYIAHPKYFESVVPDMEFLKSRGLDDVRIRIFFGLINGKYYPTAFNTEQRHFLENINPDQYEIAKLNELCKYYGQLCTAGQKLFRMNRNGQISRCASSEKKYGNLFKKSIRPDKRPKPCPKPKCDCAYEGIDCVLSIKGKNSVIIKEKIIDNVSSFKMNDINKILKKISTKMFLILSRRFFLDKFWRLIEILEKGGIPFSKIKKRFVKKNDFMNGYFICLINNFQLHILHY